MQQCRKCFWYVHVWLKMKYKLMIGIIVLMLLISYIPQDISAQGTKKWNTQVNQNCNYVPPLRVTYDAEKRGDDIIYWSVRVRAGKCVIKGYGTATKQSEIKEKILDWGVNKGTLQFKKSTRTIRGRFGGNFTKP